MHANSKTTSMPSRDTVSAPGLSVVLGTYNRLPFLKIAVESIRAEVSHLEVASEIIVVDGGSTDGTVKWLAKQKDVITIIQHNRGRWRGRDIERRSWGYFMNLGFKCAQGKYVCMLSDDCLVVPGAISNGLGHFEKQIRAGHKIGAAAFYWRNWPEQDKYWVGLTFGNKMFVNHGLYLQEALVSVGYIDEENYFFYHADGDLCLKMWQQGYTCIDSPDSYIEHYSHANLKVRSSNLEKQREDFRTYESKWEPVYGHVERAWIEKCYEDPHRTALMFRRRWFRF